MFQLKLNAVLFFISIKNAKYNLVQ